MSEKGRKEIKLTAEDIIEATKLAKQEKGYVKYGDVADKLDVSYPIFLRERQRLGLDPKRIDLSPRIPDFEIINLTEKEFIEFMIKIDDQPKSIGYDEFEMAFDEPIDIIPLGDFHLGARTTDHKFLAHTLLKIKSTSNTKVILLGDYIDNFGKYSPGGGMHNQIIDPDKQKKLVEWIVEYLGEKILGVVQGCHDEWSYTNDSFDLGQYLANKTGAIYLGMRGILKIHIGENMYKIYSGHKEKWFSSYNLCHGLKKTARDHYDFDIGLGAHNHQPCMEWVQIRGKMKLMIKVSPWKYTDRFVEKIKNPKSPIINMNFILTDKKIENIWEGIIPFMTIDQAIDYL